MEGALIHLLKDIRLTHERMKQIQPKENEFLDLATYLLVAYEAWFSCSKTANSLEVTMDAEFLLNTALYVI